MAASSTLSLALRCAVRSPWRPSRAQILRWLRVAIAASDCRHAELGVRLVGSEEGRALNRDYRGRDHATNVLAFAYSPPPAMSGDLVICLPVLLQEAAAQGKSPVAHCAHLIIHGCLHLLGHDHETEAQAEAMEALERRLLAGLGLPDPYRSAPGSPVADAVMADGPTPSSLVARRSDAMTR